MGTSINGSDNTSCFRSSFSPPAVRRGILTLPLRGLAERCQQLEALNRQYAGVTLTSSQQQLKRQLVAWYRQNCHTRRVEARN